MLNRRLFISAILALFIVMISILLMPLSSMLASDGKKMIVFIVGGMFWIFLIVGYALLIILYRRTKKLQNRTVKKAKVNKKSIKDRDKTGIFSFFANIYAKIFDGLMITSFALLIISCIVLDSSNYGICILLALFFFSANMHCLFNSRMFFYLNSK